MTARSGHGVPPARSAIRAIALNTFREAIRDRVLYLLLAFALVLIAVSRLLSLLTVGNEVKIIKDVGLSTISLFGILSAVFVGVSLVFKEIERRTVYTLLANPVARWQFVTGKFWGLLAVLAMNVGLMSAVLMGLVAFRGESPWPLLPAILLIVVELAVIVAFALLFSSLTTPMPAALATVAVYVTGHLSGDLLLLKDRLHEGPTAILMDVLYWILPHLDELNVKTAVVHGHDLPPHILGLSVVYGTGYAAIVLVLACLAFQRKEFE